MQSAANRRSRDERVVFSERSHLSGVTVRLNTGSFEQGVVTLELHPVEGGGAHPVRTAAIDIAALESAQIGHVYWEPLEASKRRFFFLRAALWQNGMEQLLASDPLLLEAKLIHSQPQPYDSLPQALLFSPVSQCNLNCTHCISRPTRAKLRLASDRVWNAVQEVTRG